MLFHTSKEDYKKYDEEYDGLFEELPVIDFKTKDIPFSEIDNYLKIVNETIDDESFNYFRISNESDEVISFIY